MDTDELKVNVIIPANQEQGFKLTWLPSTVCLIGLGFSGCDEDDDGTLDDKPPLSPPTPPLALPPTGALISDCDDESGRSRWWRCKGVWWW